MGLRAYAAAIVIGAMGILPAANAAQSLVEIREQQTRLRDDLAAGTLKLDAGDRRKVTEQQGVVFRLIQGKSDIDELDPRQQVDLRNALEVIGASVSQVATSEDDREVCWREKRTGSKLVTTICGTVRERQQAKEAARDFLQEPRACRGSGCGSSP